VTPATATLYSLSLSHPGHAARLMLERKDIEHEVKYLTPGFHPTRLRAPGFEAGTTPALRINGRRVQGSRQIAAALDEIKPMPALFPADAHTRRAVIAAEEWGEREFQPVPRRLLRWGFRNVYALRRWMGAEVIRMPAAALIAHTSVPQAAYFARLSGATDAAVRADLERLPQLLDHAEQLIEAGTIGGADPNAADFQIGTTARLLSAFDDLQDTLRGTPAADLGMRIFPAFEYRIPPFLPPVWKEHLSRA
jgi:glutathione S-transferase